MMTIKNWKEILGEEVNEERGRGEIGKLTEVS